MARANRSFAVRAGSHKPVCQCTRCMPSGGQIKIRTRNVGRDEVGTFANARLPAEDFVLVEVSDSGTGIPPEIMDKIFEPFSHTKEVGKRNRPWAFHGLRHRQQSGGYIYPESEVGVGTTFRVFLPRHIPDVQPVAPVTSHQEGAVIAASEPAKPAANADNLDLTGNSAVVLLVEDEEAVRRGASECWRPAAIRCTKQDLVPKRSTLWKSWVARSISSFQTW